MLKIRKLAALNIILCVALGSCGKGKDKKDGGKDSAKASFSGKVTTTTVAALSLQTKAVVAKKITHIMAVSPSASNAKRYVGEVAADGSFSLNIQSGKPYIIVFVAQNGILEGADMIVGAVKVASNDLDALAVKEDEDVSLGNVAVNGTTALATISTSLTSLLSSLGISADEADYIGSVDDLALRLANPDIDSNGAIDANENKNFGFDWHIRANTKIAGNDMEMNDIENAFPSATDLSLQWTLGSAYAVYAQSYDNTNYIDGSNNLTNGGNFQSTGTAVNATSHSGGTYGDMRQWGPDYDMMSQELGASDAAATFVYTLGSASKTLTFSNVRTKTKAELNADGVLLPFIKINTSGGKFTGIGYKWMKRTGSAWAEATADEVGLLVQGEGAYLSLYTEKTPSVQKGVSVRIPASSASGTIGITDDALESTAATAVADLTLDDFCSAALSYDDTIGLRIFAGAPVANASGPTPCP